MGKLDVFITLGALAACSGDATTADGGLDATTDTDTFDAAYDTASDAGADGAVQCDLFSKFGAPVEISELSSPGISISDARLSRDELTIYFNRFDAEAGEATGALYTATRASTTTPFGTPTPFADIGSSGGDFGVQLPSDLELYFWSTRTGSGDIYRATRTSTSATFGNVAAVTELNGTSRDAYPWALPDDTSLFFSSNRGGKDSIYVATRNTTADPYYILQGGQMNLVNYNEEVSPVLSDEGRIMFYAQRPSNVYDYDIYYALGPGTYSSVTKVTELSTPSDELPTWLSPDRCRLYLVRAYLGVRKLYVATKPS